MCCEDVKIDFHKRGEMGLVALTNVDQPLIGANPHRYSLVLCPPTSGDAWAITDATAVLGNGIHLTAAQVPIVISREFYGSIVGKAWRVIHSAGGVNMAVIETIFVPHGVCDEHGIP